MEVAVEMTTPAPSPSASGRWTSLWVVAAISFLLQLWFFQFFSFGQQVPTTIDINPSNLWKLAYSFPPTATFQNLNWLGQSYLPQPLNFFTLSANLPAWIFFTLYTPLVATLSLLAMAAFLREFGCPRPAALFGGVIYAWQGDILSFIYPAHFGYMTTWPFYAIAAWGALRALRTQCWAYAVISGVCCGTMVQLEQDRGGIASLLIASIYLAPTVVLLIKGQSLTEHWSDIRQLILCVGVALIVALASFLALFQTNINGVKLGGKTNRDQIFAFVTQFSMGPTETVNYLVPGFYGWHSHNPDGPYWGEMGLLPPSAQKQENTRGFNLAISTTGTIATVLGLMGIILLLPGNLLGPVILTDTQRFYGKVLLVVGFVGLVLSWGWHTPLYRPLFALPLMDKWRDPLKWLELTNFALITLSALGMQHLLTTLNDAPETRLIRFRVMWFFGVALVLLGLGFVASYPYAAYVLPIKLQGEGFDPLSIANAMSTLHTSLLLASLLVLGTGLVLFALWNPQWLRRCTLENPLIQRWWLGMLQPKALPATLAITLSLLSVTQLAWVSNQFIEVASLQMITQSNPLLDALRSEDSTVRSSAAAEDPLLNMLLLNQFSLFRIPCLDISAASRIPDDLNNFFTSLGNDRARIWFLAGVKNVAVPQQYIKEMQADPKIAANVAQAGGYTLQPTGSTDTPSHALVEMRDYLTKATFVPKAERLDSPDAVLEKLKDPKWNPRETILLDGSAPTSQSAKAVDSSAKEPAGSDKLELKTYSPSEIQIDVQSAQGGYVLINDQYDSDWQVQINGQTAPLLRADYIFRAVKVPAGNSKIEMRYVAHYRVGWLNLPTTAANLFSDTFMLACWMAAGFAVWRRRDTSPLSTSLP